MKAPAGTSLPGCSSGLPCGTESALEPTDEVVWGAPKVGAAPSFPALFQDAALPLELQRSIFSSRLRFLTQEIAQTGNVSAPELTNHCLS